jgi:hypothetical protein
MKQRTSELMPLSFHCADRDTVSEFAGRMRRVRMGDATSEECLNVIIYLYRHGRQNDLTSLLGYLESLRGHINGKPAEG